MERGSTMVFHSLIIGVILYFFMLFLGQESKIAENRSILIASCVLIYMVLFGHGMPTKLNQYI
jgi:hypothetical protein